MKKFNAHVVTGTADAVSVGSAIFGNPVHLGGLYQKVDDLSALVTVDAETNTLTLAAKWQVGNDTTTWYDVANAPNNVVATVLATGTAGADAPVTKVIPSPEGVTGFQYARLALVVGVVTGTTSDTYSIGYNYRQLTGAESL